MSYCFSAKWMGLEPLEIKKETVKDGCRYLLLDDEDDVARNGSWRLVCLAVEGDLLPVAHALGDMHLQHLTLRYDLVGKGDLLLSPRAKRV